MLSCIFQAKRENTSNLAKHLKDQHTKLNKEFKVNEFQFNINSKYYPSYVTIFQTDVPVGQIVCNGLHELALILDMQNIMLTFQINSLPPTFGYIEYSLCRNRKLCNIAGTGTNYYIPWYHSIPSSHVSVTLVWFVVHLLIL